MYVARVNSDLGAPVGSQNDAVENWVLWHVETQGEGMQAKDRHHWHPIELPLRSSTLVARTLTVLIEVVGPAGIEPATLSLEG